MLRNRIQDYGLDSWDLGYERVTSSSVIGNDSSDCTKDKEFQAHPRGY